MGCNSHWMDRDLALPYFRPPFLHSNCPREYHNGWLLISKICCLAWSTISRQAYLPSDLWRHRRRPPLLHCAQPVLAGATQDQRGLVSSPTSFPFFFRTTRMHTIGTPDHSGVPAPPRGILVAIDSTRWSRRPQLFSHLNVPFRQACVHCCGCRAVGGTRPTGLRSHDDRLPRSHVRLWLLGRLIQTRSPFVPPATLHHRPPSMISCHQDHSVGVSDHPTRQGPSQANRGSTENAMALEYCPCVGAATPCMVVDRFGCRVQLSYLTPAWFVPMNADPSAHFHVGAPLTSSLIATIMSVNVICQSASDPGDHLGENGHISSAWRLCAPLMR